MRYYCVLGRERLGGTGSGGNNGGDNGCCSSTEAPCPLGSRYLDLTEKHNNPRYGGEGMGDNENTCYTI